VVIEKILLRTDCSSRNITPGAVDQELVERATRVAPVEGALLLCCLEGDQRAELPMDQAITIQDTSLGGGRLELKGVALVST
jgi:hypothetical protein